MTPEQRASMPAVPNPRDIEDAQRAKDLSQAAYRVQAMTDAVRVLRARRWLQEWPEGHRERPNMPQHVKNALGLVMAHRNSASAVSTLPSEGDATA